MAQLVSREHLLQLVRADGKVEESSESTFSYEEFCKYHAECIEDGKRLDFRGELDDGEDKYAFAYEKVKETWLESKCPPIKFAGRGSSRAAFALAGGKCLKIATSFKGVAQNKQELKNSADKTLRCFTQNYAQAADCESLLTECCAKARKEDFQKLLGVQPFDVEYAVWLVAKCQSVSNAVKYCEHCDKPNVVEFLLNAERRKNIQFSTIADLFEFYKQRDWQTDELLPGDLVNTENWGLAARDNQLCLVILDAGFSKDVAKAY